MQYKSHIRLEDEKHTVGTVVAIHDDLFLMLLFYEGNKHLEMLLRLRIQKPQRP